MHTRYALSGFWWLVIMAESSSNIKNSVREPLHGEVIVCIPRRLCADCGAQFDGIRFTAVAVDDLALEG